MRMARCLAEKLRGCGCRAYRDRSTSQTLVLALFAQGFSPAKSRQRYHWPDSTGEPRFSMGEIEAVVRPIICAIPGRYTPDRPNFPSDESPAAGSQTSPPPRP